MNELGVYNKGKLFHYLCIIAQNGAMISYREGVCLFVWAGRIF